jgi:hypothetical protein
MTFISFKIKFNCLEFRSYCIISSTFHLFIDLLFLLKHAPKNKTLNKHLTSKLQVSPNFTLDSVADSNYRGKYDVGGFLIFEWTLLCIYSEFSFITMDSLFIFTSYTKFNYFLIILSYKVAWKYFFV